MVNLCGRILLFVHLIILTRSFETLNEGNVNDERYDFTALVQKSLSNYHSSFNLKGEDVNTVFKPLSNEDIIELFQNSMSNQSKCLHDFIYAVQSLDTKNFWMNSWAFKLFDSYGKPDSGILQGSSKWPGAYTECLSVYAPPQKNSTAGNFHGKYCSLSLGSSAAIPFVQQSISIGVCIPDSCDAFEIQEIVPKLFLSRGSIPLNGTSFKCKAKEHSLSNPAIAVIVLMSFFCTMTLLGSSVTAFKYFRSIIKEFQKESPLFINDAACEESIQHSDADDVILLEGDRNRFNGFCKKCEEFLSCFCLFKNGAKLLNTDAREGELLSIHGIRFLSMTWVILGHAYLSCFQQSKNLAEAMQLVDTFLFQIVLQGFFSVDSFFVLSGFLLVYLSMNEFSKTKGHISWPYFYIHRYLRLTPVYMIVLGFSASVYFYLGSGPFWPDADFDPICRDTWWRNLLYINNFNPRNEQCMGWSWYLANDMQFFIISPLFLITLWRWPKIGFSVVALFLLASWLANFFITYHYDLMCGIVDILHLPKADALSAMVKFQEYFDKLYIKPYTRIGPYLIGILTGYFLFKRRMSHQAKHNWVTLCIGWIIASALTLTVVYGLYHSTPPIIARSFYNAFNRICFAIGLSWVIYVCLIGQGGKFIYYIIAPYM